MNNMVNGNPPPPCDDDDGEDYKLSDLNSRFKISGLSNKFMLQLIPFFLLSFMLFSLLFLPTHLPFFFQPQLTQSLNKDFTASAELPKDHDELLGGLLSAGFDKRSCLSRYMSNIYGKGLSEKPSSYLISRLRKYESLHKKCGPHTESYNKTVKEFIRSGHFSGSSSSGCNYVVWIPLNGLGNRILTLVSSFLYSLLTNRVLLVDPGVDMRYLFCEPFPDVSWFLPHDFPLTTQLPNLNQNSPQCYGKMMKENSTTNSTLWPSYFYLHLVHDYNYYDMLFFCDEGQSYLQKVPWLIMRSGDYFVPSFFLMPSFEQQLNSLFPKKDTIFHFLGRYLFHPTNKVWGQITRYYEAYLANADEIIGIQIRVFNKETSPFQVVMDQILSCALKENLLPDVNRQEQDNDDAVISTGRQKSKAVLITSLSSGYYEKIRDMYGEYPTVTGELVRVYQPSNEEYQQTDKLVHDQKALAEMYLLSFTDVLVTSSRSTFGYVAQGLGGLKPWLLYKPEDNKTVQDHGCRRVMVMEPCFHDPPVYDCNTRRVIDTGDVVPHVRHCEDVSWGL